MKVQFYFPGSIGRSVLEKILTPEFGTVVLDRWAEDDEHTCQGFHFEEPNPVVALSKMLPLHSHAQIHIKDAEIQIYVDGLPLENFACGVIRRVRDLEVGAREAVRLLQSRSVPKHKNIAKVRLLLQDMIPLKK